MRKVWLLLEEKQVDYETEKVPMRSYGHWTGSGGRFDKKRPRLVTWVGLMGIPPANSKTVGI